MPTAQASAKEPARVTVLPSDNSEVFLATSRLHMVDELVRDLSLQDDPESLIRAFSRQGDLFLRIDGIVSLSRRGLESPAYRVTRSWKWKRAVNPWTEAHRLPVFDRGLLGELLYAGQPVLLPRFEVAADDPAREHFEGMRSLICAPGYDHGEALNMTVVLRREPDSFAPHELETLLLHANLIGRATLNLVLAQQLREAHARLEQEMATIGRMQRHLLPAELPRLEGLELAASYHTCNRAGGDYYDVLPLPDGRWGFFVADVSGHGTPAAMVMAMLHTLLHAHPGPLHPPSQVLAHLNRHLMAVAPEGMFATAFYGVYDPQPRRLCYASAGHPPPRLRRGPYAVRDVHGKNGLPLGVLPDETWSEAEVTLVPGDELLLYTDGILEGTNVAGEPFGRQRLDDALRLAPLRAGPLVRHVERQYKDYCHGAPDLDDRTLLAAVAVP
jgi:sigma-B regulation protein RsbU (phosphoserine phosphatase)